MNAFLRRVFLASLLRRPISTGLSLLAIVLGVALGLAVHLIHGAALDEFGRNMRLLAGSADLQVLAGREGFDDSVYIALAQRADVAQASPVLEIEVLLPDGDRRLRLFGIDPLRAMHVHPALVPVVAMNAAREESEERDASGLSLSSLRPGGVFLSAAARNALNLDFGDRFEVLAGTRRLTLSVEGGLPGAGVGQQIGVMDIAAAQDAFGRVGRITRVDLRVVSGFDRETVRDDLTEVLPAGVAVLTPEGAESQSAGLSRAYRVNLTMLAAIALLTGVFLVFSTQLLSVARRRREFAFLRALGLDRPALERGILAEGAVIGLAGGGLGVAAGYALSAGALAVAGGDLGAGYFTSVGPRLGFSGAAIGVYLVLGTVAGIAGAWLPARAMGRTPPAHGLQGGDDLLNFPSPVHGFVALAAFVLAGILCLLPPLDGIPVAGYGAVGLILAGALLILPGVSRLSMRAFPIKRTALQRLAHARLLAAPGQTTVAGAGVVASVALAVAMAIMVSSFRASVDDWLAQMLPADIYLRASAAAASGFLPPEVVDMVSATEGVDSAESIRFATVRIGNAQAPVTLIARPVAGGISLPLVEGDSNSGEPEAHDPAALPPVWVSEAAADLLGFRVGERIQLPLAGRLREFRVAGVWRDYARQHGAVMIELSDYRALSGDRLTNDIAIRLENGARPDLVANALRAALAEHEIEFASPGEIRAISLSIFDRTFLITYLMEAVAVLIGLFGISTSYAALATARSKEFGMLRHLGLTRGEVGRLLAMEGAMTAAVAVIVGILAGAAIALVLIEVVNRQSFHWSMDIHVPGAALFVFSIALIGLAAIAARLSGAQAMRQSAVLAVREDW